MQRYKENDILKLAKRINNSKRSYLLVNPLQAKHIPVSPSAALQMMTSLGELVSERYGDARLVIGFAVILLIILQVLGGTIVSVFLEGISNSITFISQSNIYLILSCFAFVISIYLPYLLLKSYIPKEDVEDNIIKEKIVDF